MKRWRVFQSLVLLALLLVFGACQSTPLPAARPPPIAVLMVPVCGKPAELNALQNMWAYSETMRLVPSTNDVEFPHAARFHGRFYTYDSNADPANSATLPIAHQPLQCTGRRTSTAWTKPTQVHLVGATVIPIAPLAPCLLLRRRALALFEPESTPLRAEYRPDDSASPDPRWVAQSAHAHGGASRIPGPVHPDSTRLAQDDARKRAIELGWKSGHKLGTTLAGIEAGLELLGSKCSRFEEDLRENPQILEDIQKKIANTINEVPLPPQYSEPELQGLSVGAFSRGFEEGFGARKLEFLALSASSTIAILVFPNVVAAVETVGARAIRLALERVRSIPIYVPAVTNGAGFFLKIPKAPPANANGPAIAPLKAPPAITPPAPPPPFGNLSRAAEFGVLTEAQMAKAIAGTGLQRHHLLEQRFLRKMEGDPRMNLTVAVTAAEHQQFTNAWRQEIAYGAAGTYTATREQIIAAARKIYARYPAILKALDL